MHDELQQVVAVDGAVAEADAVLVPVRVKATTADLHDRAGPAQRRQGVGSDLPGHCRRVIQRVIKAAGCDVQASIGGAGISRTQRVELLD
jgi:hypothetical protein